MDGTNTSPIKTRPHHYTPTPMFYCFSSVGWRKFLIWRTSNKCSAIRSLQIEFTLVAPENITPFFSISSPLQEMCSFANLCLCYMFLEERNATLMAALPCKLKSANLLLIVLDDAFSSSTFKISLEDKNGSLLDSFAIRRSVQDEVFFVLPLFPQLFTGFNAFTIIFGYLPNSSAIVLYVLSLSRSFVITFLSSTVQWLFRNILTILRK